MLGVMTTAQRYVSKELSHFAGAGKAEADQYDILLRILRSGELRHGGRVDSDIPNPGGISSHAPGIVRFDPTRLVTRHESVVPEAVCFCDIPVEDLELHTSKYSRFGLSFVKEFLLPKGASPVFYVAANARTVTREAAGGKKGEVFDQEVSAYLLLWPRLYRRLLDELDPNATRLEGDAREFAHVNMFLLHEIFSYLKFFDESRSDDDPENFYMEREWRVTRNVAFSLDDVYRVFLPAGYARRFREDVPAYSGQVTFV